MKLYDLSKLSVLIVDDNKFMRSTMFQVLYGLGVRNCMQAENPNVAISYVRDSPIDIVISDWDMGPKSGLDLVREIRAAAESQNRLVSIIMLTGNATRRNVTTARDSGITEFLAKPVSAQSLYARIVEIIENPRQFVKTGDYFGPDRRRKKDEDYEGPKRRSEDQE